MKRSDALSDTLSIIVVRLVNHHWFSDMFYDKVNAVFPNVATLVF